MLKIQISSITGPHTCLSFVDNSLVPEDVQKIFERVRANADFMPQWQLDVRWLIIYILSLNKSEESLGWIQWTS